MSKAEFKEWLIGNYNFTEFDANQLWEDDAARELWIDVIRGTYASS